MSTGTVKFFSARGFGFIKDDFDGKEYFYHATSSFDRCEKDERVTFSISENKRGVCAVSVKRLKTGKDGNR
jgi:CspA family cold shock protein